MGEVFANHIWNWKLMWKYIKKSYSSTRRQVTQVENWQGTCINISQKKIEKWLIYTLKNKGSVQLVIREMKILNHNDILIHNCKNKQRQKINLPLISIILLFHCTSAFFFIYNPIFFSLIFFLLMAVMTSNSVTGLMIIYIGFFLFFFFHIAQNLLHPYANNFLICCFCSVAKSWLTLCNPMNYSMPSFPVLHYLLEFAQSHVPWVSDAIQPSHPLLSPSLALNLSHHQDLFQRVNSLNQVTKVRELQLQYQSF